MADVNGLKLINDSFGHAIGDDLLKKAAEVISRNVEVVISSQELVEMNLLFLCQKRMRLLQNKLLNV
ncbi:diguanylate cyclase [Anaerobacillus sp. HL2]|nr:diguanylate cyclase [Anaerobacillus sp. HL2]